MTSEVTYRPGPRTSFLHDLHRAVRMLVRVVGEEEARRILGEIDWKRLVRAEASR